MKWHETKRWLPTLEKKKLGAWFDGRRWSFDIFERQEVEENDREHYPEEDYPNGIYVTDDGICTTTVDPPDFWIEIDQPYALAEQMAE